MPQYLNLRGLQMVRFKPLLGERFKYDSDYEEIPISIAALESRNRVKEKIEKGIYKYEDFHCYCGNNDSFVILSEVDWYGFYYPFVICKKCGIMRTTPRLIEESYSDFYASEYRTLYGDNDLDKDKLYELRLDQARKIYDFISMQIKLSPGATVIDIGCNMGTNLVPFQQNGYNCVGVDYDESYLEIGRKKNALTLIEGGVEQLKPLGVKADLIILNHVLEHFSDIDKEMKQIRSIMKHKGYIFISLPGIFWWTKNICKGNIMGILQNAHTWQFSSRTLKYIMECEGFEEVYCDDKIMSIFQIVDRKKRSRDNIPCNEAHKIIRFLKKTEVLYQQKQLFIRIINQLPVLALFKTRLKRFLGRREHFVRLNTLCFLGRTPFSKRDYERFGVDLLKKRGFNVLFIDLTFLLNPDFLNVYKSQDQLDSSEVIRFKTRMDFNIFLKRNKNIFVIDLMGGLSDSWFIYRAFRRFNIRYASFVANSFPFASFQKPNLMAILFAYLNKIRRMKNLRDIKRTIKGFLANRFAVIIYSLPHNLSRLQPPSLILAGGYKYDMMLPKADAKTETLFAHTLDYDLYLKNKNMVNNNNCCIFLDQYFPYDTDLPTFTGKMVRSIKSEDYYKGLNLFFSWFEDRYRIPITIAAHPRADYQENDKRFFGRKTIKADTARLVSGAKCILTHTSTAINFAVIYRKPIIFLTNDQIESTIFGQTIHQIATMFNRKPINVDHLEGYRLIERDFAIKETIYQAFLSNYIKIPQTQERFFWDIVADRILTLS